MPENLDWKIYEELRGVKSFLFFDEEGHILATSLQGADVPSLIDDIKSTFKNGREEAVRNGIRLQEHKFEVHRYDLPLVYGRTMAGDPVHSEAFAIQHLDVGPGGRPMYALITFVLPELSAKKVPELIKFCSRHLQTQDVAAKV